LRSRIWKAAALSGTFGLVPIPGTSFVADAVILVRETKFYYQQLGLDSESLRRLSQETGAEFSTLQTMVEETICVNIMEFEAKNFLALISSLGIAMAVFQAESAVEQLVALVPVIGQAVAGAMSSVTTYWILGEILDKMYDVAKEVIELATKQLQ